MSERVPRLTLVFAVVAALLTGLGSSGQVEDSPIAPYDQEATQVELDFWSETFACPELPGLERLGDREGVSVDDVIANSRSCTYRTPSGQTHTLEILWDKSDDPFDSYCLGREDSRDTGTTVTARLHTEGRTHSMQGTYRLGTDAVALEAEFESAIRTWMAAAAPFVRVCPDAPISIVCPPLHGREAGDTEPEQLEPDTYRLGCFYSADEAHPSSVAVTLWWVAPNALSELTPRTCGEDEYARNGAGLVRSDDRATLAVYFIASPLEESDEEGIVAVARQLVVAAEDQAISCDGVDVSGVDDPYSEVPAYLAPAFSDEFLAPPAGTLFDGPGDGGGAPDIFGSDPVAATAGGGAGTLSKVITIGMLALSLLGLLITFLLVRRETRVRPGRDIFRVVVTGGVAILMVVVFSRGAPLWAVAAGVGAGLALGAWQGSNLTVRLTERGLYAKRGTIAIVAFASGIAVSQVAGLLNRTGALTIGIAMSFLSASLTVGLILGRNPRIAEARVPGPAVGLFLVVALVLTGFVAAAPGQAQEASQTVRGIPGTCDYFLGAPSGPGSDESRCDGHRLMIDLVDWDRVGVAGGLFWTGRKPFTEIAVPRALDDAPQPLTQSIEWISEEGSSVYQVTETFEFSLREDGRCCSVAYQGSGSETITRGNGDIVVVTREASGRLHDIQPVGVALNGPFVRGPASVFAGTPFSEIMLFSGQPEDACNRLVAESVSSIRQEGAWDTYLQDGEARDGDFQLTMAMVIGCDLPGFTYQAALAAAPPPPPGDDPARDGCPVRQELMESLLAVSGLDGVATQTVSDLFLKPNEAVCVGGGDFGEGGRGGTRHELSIAFQGDDPISWAKTVVLFEENWFFFFRPDRIPEDERCDIDADGVPVRPPGEEGCEVISMHLIPLPSSISGVRQTGSSGMVWMRTDYFADGPNVNVRALLRGVEYRYRCHHCLPGDSRITDFLKGLHGFSSQTRIEITGSPPAVVAAPATPVAAEPSPDAEAPTDEGDLSEDAATAALIGLLGSAALLAAAMAESGLTSPAELLAAIRRGDLAVGALSEPEARLEEPAIEEEPPEEEPLDEEPPESEEPAEEAEEDAAGEEPAEGEPTAEDAEEPSGEVAPPAVLVIPPETPVKPKSDRMADIKRRAIPHRIRRDRREFDRQERWIAEQEKAAVSETVSWTNVSRTAYDVFERLTSDNLPRAVRDALAGYNPGNPFRTSALARAVSSTMGDKADDFVRAIKQTIRSLPHPAANSMAALTNAGDHLDMWAKRLSPRAHIQASRATLGRMATGFGAALDIGRAVDRGSEIIREQGLQGEGIIAQTGAYALGGVHVAMHTVLTKNPIALVADVALSVGTGGRVSVDAALTELEDGFFRTTKIAASTAGEYFSDAPVERGASMQRDRVIDAIRRTSARTDLSEDQKVAKLGRLRGLLGSS